MKKILKWIAVIVVFIVMIPLSFLFFCLLATIQQGHPVNSIIQAIVMGICAIASSGFCAKWIYEKF